MIMAKDEVILRFDKVSFEYGVNKPILDEVSFPLRRGSKITIMGQNGAGKSTMFGLFAGTLDPESGTVVKNIKLSLTKRRGNFVLNYLYSDMAANNFIRLF